MRAEEKITALNCMGVEIIEKIHPGIKFSNGKLEIQLQIGHPGEAGSIEGCFPTHAIKAMIELFKHYQTVMASPETAKVIEKLTEAWLWLQARKLDREERNVLQTDKK